MTYKVTVLGLAVGLLALVAEQANAWEPFESEEGRFEAEMPATPTYNSSIVPTEYGDITFHTHLSETNAGDAVWFVMYCDYPEGAISENAIEVLQGARDGAVADADMELAIDEEYEIEGAKAWEYAGTADYEGNEVVLHCRAFLYDSRLYQVMVVYDSSFELEDDVEHFLDSFQALPD